MQPEPLCQRVDLLPPRARLHLAGGECAVELARRSAGHRQALRAMADVVEPCLRWVPATARGDRQSLWAELLYAPGMASISRALAPDRKPLRYHRIERSANQVLITVTNGQGFLTRTVDLDAGQLPVALPVEIAESPAPQASRSTHWGATPPRAGPRRAWMRRLFRGP